MNGFIANTDPDWHARLLVQARMRRRPHEEFNFWRLSTRPFVSLVLSQPLVWRLKSHSGSQMQWIT